MSRGGQRNRSAHQRSRGGHQRSFFIASGLIGRRVVAANGRELGHVIDVELHHERNGFRVAALELGRYGWLDRLHVLRPLARRIGGSAEPRLVDWELVERAPKGEIRLRTSSTRQSAQG
jgi:sporulation protein YlmC with PRC-barrel domain